MDNPDHQESSCQPAEKQHVQNVDPAPSEVFVPDGKIAVALRQPIPGQPQSDVGHGGGSAPGTPTNEFGAPVAAELLDEVAKAKEAGGGAASDADIRAELAAERDDGDTGAGPAVNVFGAPVAAELLQEAAQAEAAASSSLAAAAASVAAATDADAVEASDTASLAAALASVAAALPADEAATATTTAVDEPPPATAAPVAAVEPLPAPPPPPSLPAVTVDAGTPPARRDDGGGCEPAAAQSSIRVTVDALEDLMTLVSELVLTRNQLLQMVRGVDDHEFTVPLQRLSHITSDLQEGVMKTRMQPIGNAWAKLPRIVRDLPVESGKRIELVMNGAETELDRQVLELIKDPLTHMVRNSADHGLEAPADRLAAGKPETGTITLNAYHEGGHIIIEIGDDGRGLSMARIRRKCVDNGLAGEAEIDAMTDQQVQQFIFKPGFSTAEKVTSVSGRGVGMDVVRTNIERIGGHIDLRSFEGRGATFTIKIPLTLVIVSSLIVASGDQRFAVPQISVLELVRVSEESEHRIERINESPVLRLRNRLLPLVSLAAILGLDGDAAASDEAFVVVSQVDANTFGILVDRVFDTEEIVVKPVSPILRHIPFYSGNTILGDGSVIMILDPNGVAEHIGKVAAEPALAAADAAAAQADEQRTSLLVFRAGGPEWKAVPLALVARLEEVDLARVETVHGKAVVQYRGRLMPLVPCHPGHRFAAEGRQPVLVFSDQDRAMGLVVDEIVDIVEDRLNIELAADEPGWVGSAIIGGRATDVIDAGHFLTQAFDDWFGTADRSRAAPSGDRRALLVDDSPFFRNLLSPVLSVAGWKVTAVESADAALRFRDQGTQFDVIISDIEMPGMDGLAFAGEVRADPRWGTTPMVALSARASDADVARGHRAGFDQYVAKSDRDALVGTLAETVARATAAAG